MVTRYASALVDVVTGPAGTDAAQANQQLRAFAAVLAGSAELRNALTSPAVSPARKRAVVGRLADQLGVAKMVRNFLLVLSDHRRLAALAQMIEKELYILFPDTDGESRPEQLPARPAE